LLPVKEREMASNGARGNRDNDIDAELEFHFAEAVDALVERGLTERAARAEVERRFGDRQSYERDLGRIGRLQKEKQGRRVMDDTTSRRPTVSLVVESIVRDVYFGCRLLWKNVTVTVVAVVSLSLAIGAHAGWPRGGNPHSIGGLGSCEDRRSVTERSARS
jgi:hypothetical protein